MNRLVRTLLPAVVLVLIAATGFAQATTGRISGRVSDAQGGLLPGASVTVTEVRTNYSRSVATDAQGAYVFVNLPLGTYTVSAELQGFNKAVKTDYVLVADGRLTADFNLAVGNVSETVEVTVRGETVNTVSGEVARTVDRQQVQSLALNGRNYLQLTTLIPGAPDLNPNALDIMTGLGINTSINGSRTNATLLAVDGGFNMDSGSNNSQISNVGIDFIEEVSIKTANFSAEYGRNSGAAVNIVTRSRRQPVPRQRVRVPAQRGARRQQLLQQRAQGPEARPQVQRFRRRARRPDHQGQALLLRGRRVEADRPLHDADPAHAAHHEDARRRLQRDQHRDP